MRGKQNGRRPKPIGGLSTGVLKTNDWNLFPKPGQAVSYLQWESHLTLPDPQTHPRPTSLQEVSGARPPRPVGALLRASSIPRGGILPGSSI